MLDLFENVWGSREKITVEHAVDLTLPVGPHAFFPEAFPDLVRRLPCLSLALRASGEGSAGRMT